ncbi:MAG: NAD(P)/FAD-dependent oxidoreductase [Hyalangium sp.]|uniref:NAD(P)/FAD-dependent oxidoreductase n=1 Tax=Hyalangium sp. TaxID=2028555 RepID=UPI00389B26EE
MYDAIVIGARCAGSPAAMLLARKGHKVLLVDRARFPSDTLSTHFFHPRGTSYLNRWGVLDKVLSRTPSFDRVATLIDGIPGGGAPTLERIRRRFAQAHGEGDAHAIRKFCAPRRVVLDDILLRAASEAGAEVRTEFTVDELLFEGDRVVGIKGRDVVSGAPVTEKARVVIGADGRHSFVARTLKVPNLAEKSDCTFAYYAYFSGIPHPATMQQRGRMSLSFFPTSDGLMQLLVFGPAAWFGDFKADIEENYFKGLAFVSPEIAELARTQGKREERFMGTADQPNYMRHAAGPGWLLAGDAAYNKDQCTAMGMTHAFRDAELLSATVHEGLSGAKPLDAALQEYATRRHADSAPYFDFVTDMATMQPMKREQLQLIAALSTNQEWADDFAAVYSDTLMTYEFFAPENLGRIMGSAKLPSYPILEQFDAISATYREPPFPRRA